MEAPVMIFVLSLMSLVATSLAQNILDCNFDNAAKQSENFICDCNGAECPLVQDILSDDFNWMAWQGGTPSADTGPLDDHTSQDGSGLYMYAEASDQNPGNVALIQTPGFSLTQTGCLTFWFSMTGQHVGQLEVIANFYNNTQASVWIVSGQQGSAWVEGKLALDPTINKVLFRTIRGGDNIGMPYGDIAMDDIKITNSLCSGLTVPPTDPTTPTPTTAAPTANPTTSSTTTPTTQTTTPTPQPATSRLSSTAKPATTNPATTPTPTTRSPTPTTQSPATPTPTTSTPAPTTHTDSTATSSPAASSTTSSASLTGDQAKLWGMDETLWIIILVVLGAVILVLLVIVLVQACAMRRMRTARIVRQSDDYSNIEAYTTDPNFPGQRAAEPKRDNYINAYDNMGHDHDNNKAPHSNGGGGML